MDDCVSSPVARADSGGEGCQNRQGTTYDQKQYVPSLLFVENVDSVVYIRLFISTCRR